MSAVSSPYHLHPGSIDSVNTFLAGLQPHWLCHDCVPLSAAPAQPRIVRGGIQEQRPIRSSPSAGTSEASRRLRPSRRRPAQRSARPTRPPKSWRDPSKPRWPNRRQRRRPRRRRGPPNAASGRTPSPASGDENEERKQGGQQRQADIAGDRPAVVGEKFFTRTPNDRNQLAQSRLAGVSNVRRVVI